MSLGIKNDMLSRTSTMSIQIAGAVSAEGSDLAARREIFTFGQYAFVIVDVVLPAMFRPSVVRIEACTRKQAETNWFWCGKRASKPDGHASWSV